MITPTFLPVAGGDFKISDIKVDGAVGMGEVNMQNMGSDGRFEEKTYYYLTTAGWVTEDGWYLDEWGTVPVDDTDIIKFGHGFSLSSGETEISLQYSGEVKSGDPIVSWDAGDGFLSNPTPVRQYFSDIVVEGAIGMGEVNCQKMLPSGQWEDKTYYYLTTAGWVAEDGWYLDEWGTVPVTEEDFLEPGMGVCLTATDVDLTITFKKVID